MMLAILQFLPDLSSEQLFMPLRGRCFSPDTCTALRSVQCR
jgi:hypothetical protein